jgi:DNA (cytosine-5)-methyltransferase 1
VTELWREKFLEGIHLVMSKVKFIDLFAGIGGMRLAFEAAGAECVFTSEWDKFAVQTYVANHGVKHPIFGDIKDVDPRSVPSHDILVAGFPCQPFSLAGVSKKNSLGKAHGFADETQGTLFFYIAEILRQKKPKAFLLENVKNLVGHDKGNTFRVIQKVLEEDLGYHITFKVIDAAKYLPQHRERIYIVGFKSSKVKFDWDKVKPNSRKAILNVGEILQESLPAPAGDAGKYFDQNPSSSSKKYVLSDKLWRYLKEYAAKHKKAGNGFGYGLANLEGVTRTLSARYHKDGSEILIPSKGSRNPRRLTPRECARLMGFPDHFSIPVSDTQAYRQFGNSVAVPVVSAIAKEIVRSLR